MDEKVTSNEQKITSKAQKLRSNEQKVQLPPNLAIKVPSLSNPFTSFLNETHSIMEKQSLSKNELKEAFFSLKANKTVCFVMFNP